MREGRWTCRAWATIVLTAALVAVPLDATAAPREVGCRGGAYPVTAGAVVEVSSTHPRTGSGVLVGGTGFCPGERVQVRVDAAIAAGTRADADGAFTGVAFTAPRPGPARVCAIGSAGGSACVTIEAVATAALTAHGGSGSRSAVTGARVAALVAVAALLLASGVALATAGRRHTASRPG